MPCYRSILFLLLSFWQNALFLIVPQKIRLVHFQSKKKRKLRCFGLKHFNLLFAIERSRAKGLLFKGRNSLSKYDTSSAVGDL